MAKDTDIQVAGNLTDSFRGYAALLRKIKQRVQIAQQRAIYDSITKSLISQLGNNPESITQPLVAQLGEYND